jgi:hypothetical protein
MLRHALKSALLLVSLSVLASAAAQTPIALPTTMTTVNSSSSAAARGGMVVDAEGNVFITDDVGGKVYLADQSSGTSSVFIGSVTSNCSGAFSSSGDGCAFANIKSTTNMRSIGIDPYGNVLLAGYGDELVHILCRAASPLCTTGTPSPSATNPIQVPVGTMGLVAGCTTGSAGTKASGAENAPAFQTASSTYSTSTFKTSTCTTTGTTYSPYAVTADVYGNVYYAELGAAVTSERWRVVVGPASYNGITNPIYAVLAKNTAWTTITPGYVYTVADGNTSTTDNSKGNACATAISGWVTAGTATDTYGDGCLFTSSVEPGSTSYASGVVVDAAGNMLYTDPGRGLRVLFVSDGTNFSTGTAGYIAGQAMKNAIYVNNSSFSGFTSAVPGYVYMLAGGGTTAISATPTLGTSTTISTTGMRRLAISPQGNVYMGVYSSTAGSNTVYFFDINTGYVRTLLVPGTNPSTAGAYCNGSSGAISVDTLGDGCPVGSTTSASFATFGNTNSELPLAVDGQGNVYIYDSVTSSSNTVVRKVLAQGMAPLTLGTAQTQTFAAHLYGATAATTTMSYTSNYDFNSGSQNCTLRGDNSVDCTLAVTVTPSAAGLRSATATFANASSGESLTVNAGAVVTGSVLTADNASAGGTSIAPTTSAIFSSITPANVALDGAANVYTASGTSVLESIRGTSYTLTPALTATPSQIAVDAMGDIFAVNTATSTIQELMVSAAGSPSTYTSTTIAYSNGATPEPVAVAVDKVGNLYVADAATESVYMLSLQPNTLQPQSTIATGFSNITNLTVDASGIVYVADKSAGAVYKLTPGVDGVFTQTTDFSGIEPVSVAVDAAGDVYVQDLTSSSVLMKPVSGPSTVPVLTGLSKPVGLAVDGLGNIYSADSNNTSITEVLRGAGSYNFGTSETTTYNATLTDAGNQAITGSNTVTNTTNFAVTGGSSNGCTFTTSILGALTAGQSCNLTASLIGNGSGTVTDALTFLPGTSTTGSLTLTGTLQGQAIATTTTISAPTPSSPVYSASGTEATFTVTVAAQTGSTAPGGTVSVTVDSTTTNPTLVASGANGVATVTITGLNAGTHTISATYATSGSFTGSNSGTAQSFPIGQITTSVNWTPSATTQPVSQAIGTGVLDASATPTTVAGNYVYTATPSGGSAITIDASTTTLPIGTYALGVTFYPNDLKDYTTSTASVGTYTVTQASTTAVAGATTNLVASDGTGNYTTLSAALAALPTTGGAIYLKPGSYSGQNAISYPNVSLRGLGGDPTKVVLTAEDGAFSSPYTGYLGTGTGAGNDNANGDQGSSTLDVSKSYYMGQTAGSTSSPVGVTNSTQYTPTNFYAEYLTVQNTYNTDTSNTSSYNTSSGSCAAGTAQTLQSLYNAGTECNSQALALWITGDQAILNNVNLTSQQDTLYAGSQGCGSPCTAARQYMWKGTITGDVDYVFGDAALVFDHTNFFTTWHGTAATGTETIEAQNKKAETGSSSDYLSGYICNSCILMSQSTGMSALYYGRPYGEYSTWIMLNSYVDQVNPVGWIEFSGDTNLPTSTYAEYNTTAYTDPAVGTAPYPAGLFYENAADIPNFTGTAGYVVTPTGLNIGSGVTGTRETTSMDSGTLEAGNTLKTQLTAAQAAQYAPVTFLSTTVPTQTYTGFTANWNPATALTSQVNAFASTGNVTLSVYGGSVTILGRPQTPGAGIIPTGSYAFYDSLGTSQSCSAAGGGCTLLASGTLDASGEAYLVTGSASSFGPLAAGTHYITMVYGGDTNFSGSTSALVTITVPASLLTATTTSLTVTNPSSTYGGAITGSVTVAPQSGSGTPAGTVTFYAGTNAVGSCTLSGGSCSYSLSGVGAGLQQLTAYYGGNSTYSASDSAGATINVSRVLLDVTATSYTINVGASLPTYAYTITGFVNSDTQATAVSGAPTLTSTATSSATPGEYPIAVTTGTLSAANYTFTFTGGYLRVVPASAAAAVATGDARTVTEPTFPAVCQQLTATIASVNNDIPTSVDATTTNPDGSRIQAALNSCSTNYPGEAVELSMGGTGNNAFLSGPLSMPSNVTLLVDPGVVLFFSRNVQDYDKTSGTHTCGTINGSTATNTCLPLIDIPKTSTGVGIMGYGKLDARGGDTLLNGFATSGYTAPSSYTWWTLATQADNEGNQQNPRFIQIEGGASNITLYKITLRNSPMFHVSTTGSVTGFTAWDVKVVTPTTARNTDGIDPGNVTNWTVTRSWISDGDDDIAIGASGSSSATNISITNNHIFAGHGQSIGSYTSGGVSNVLFDGNIAAGNGFSGTSTAQYGSSVSSTGSFLNGARDGTSTGIRIKSADDRGGVVQNIQYSNECLLDHSVDLQFTPLYNTNTGTSTPNFKNILLQNVVIQNDDSSTGTVQFTGAVNPPTGTATTINPLQVTLDNVTFPSALGSSSFVTSGSSGTETNAQLSYGPGDVSTNFINAWATVAGSNGDTVTNNITASSLQPQACTYTYLAPELTGPTGLPQTITVGQNATAVVILTPAVGGAAYPTGTVTLTDALTSNTYTATLSGSSDTVFIPLSGLTAGTHTFTATYSGDTNYVVPSGSTYYTSAGSYTVTVNAGNLPSTTTGLALTASSTPYGTPITASATVTGANPTGTVQFVVSGGGLTGSSTYATSTLTAATSTTATASASLNLPGSSTAYNIVAIYSGDNANAGSNSSSSPLTVFPTPTVALGAFSPTSPVYGQAVTLNVTVSSTLSTTPAGSVVFTVDSTTYNATLSGGAASVQVSGLAAGQHSVSVAYTSSNGFPSASSGSSTLTVSKASLTITASASSTTYGTAPTVTPSYGTFAGSDTAASLTTAPTCTSTVTASSAVGTYTGANTCSGAVDPNYTFVYAAANAVVNQATLTITASNTSTAVGVAPTVTPSYSGFVGSDTSTSLTTQPTCTSTVTASSAAGTYNGANTCSGAVDANYAISYVAGNAVVGKATLTITASTSSTIYGTAPAITPSYSGFAGSDTAASLTTAPTCVSTVTASTAPGVYNGANTCSGAVDPNYTFVYVAGNAIVSQKTLTITASSTSTTYGTAPTVTPSYSGFVGSDTASNLTTQPTCVSTVTASTAAGSYTGANTCSGAVSTNYTIGYVAGNAAVNKASLTVTASSSSTTYGTAPTVTPSYSGFVGSDTATSLTTAPTCVSTVTASTAVGTYTGGNTCSGAVDANYTIGYVAGNATVNKASLTVTASSSSTTYGTATTVTPSYSGFVGSDTASSLSTAPTCVSTVTASSAVGTYTGANTCSGAVDANYTIAYVAANAVVNKASLTVTASSTSTTYGTAPTVTPSYSGFVGSDTASSLSTAPTCVSTVTASSAVGTYTGANTCSGAVDANYTIAYVAGNATVNKATLTITASSSSTTYGTAPAVTPSYSGFVGSDTATSLTTKPTCVSTVTASTAVGTYTGANTCSGAVDANYTIGYVAGNAVVGKATLTITASNTSTTVGTVPVVTPSYSGFVGSDTATSLTTAPTCVSTVTASTAAGSYTGANTCSGAVDANYTIGYVAGNATVVSPSAPVITGISPGFVEEGASAFTLTVTGTGFTANSTVYWGSSALTTTYVSGTGLTAQVPAADVASAVIANITVQTSGVASNSMQFAVDSTGAQNGPTFSVQSVQVTPGSPATYLVTLPSSATNVSVQCLNLPAYATCSYANDTLTITTTSSTPAGTYVVTAVFTETIPTSSTGMIFLPILLLPLVAIRKRWAKQQIWLVALLAIAFAAGMTAVGCGGHSGSTPESTVTSSGSVTLIVN